MKLGLIADIHGNLPALEKVLGELDRQGVEKIICAGDLVCYGAQHEAVIDLLRERDIPCVVGNYDAAVAFNLPSAARRPSTPQTEPLKQAALAWAKAHIGDESLAFLRKLPDSSTFVLDGITFGMLHAGLHALDEWLTPDQPAGLLYLAQHFPADVIVLGHTHLPFVYECPLPTANKTLFINPGAVGRSLDGNPAAAYAIFDTHTHQPTHYRVAYDLARTIAAIYESGMPGEIATLVRQAVRRIEQASPE